MGPLAKVGHANVLKIGKFLMPPLGTFTKIQF
jgi:hypothetical protein